MNIDIKHTIFNESGLKNDIKNIITTKLDVKKRGSVFTNEETIITLLELLPNSVWTNKTYKWLDPGSGIGNIMIYIYFKLMNTIDIKCDETRRKHIIENMLYFVEINDNYIKIIKHIFIDSKYKINIHNGSFVEMNIEKDNQSIYSNESLFDVIVTNPPYQKPNKQGNASAKPLYHLFIHKSLELLKPNGYLVAIHPFTWRRKSREIKLLNDILKYHIIYMYTNNNFKAFDKSAIHINYYLLKKTTDIQKTVCDNYFNNKYYSSEILLNKEHYDYLPILLTNESMSIIDKLTTASSDKLNIKHQSKLSSTHSPSNTNIKKDHVFKYKNYHTYSLKLNENIYRYTKEKHPSHDLEKIVMNFKGGYKIFKPFIDISTMGITDCGLYIDITKDEDKEYKLNFLKSDIFKFILMITSYNYSPNMKNEFHILNTLSLSDNYNLSQSEKNLISSVIEI